MNLVMNLALASMTAAASPDPSANTNTQAEAARLIAEKKQAATRMTASINDSIRQLETLLSDSLAADHCFDWNRVRKSFPSPEPQLQFTSQLPPKPTFSLFLSRLPGLESFIPSLCKIRLEWSAALEQNNKNRALASAEHKQASAQWRAKRDEFDLRQTAAIEEKASLYRAKDPATLTEY